MPVAALLPCSMYCSTASLHASGPSPFRVQACSSWRYTDLEWRIFLVLLDTCSVQGRQQHQGSFLDVLGACIVPASRRGPSSAALGVRL